MFKNLVPWRRKAQPNRTDSDLAAMPAFGQLERMRQELDRFYRGDLWDDGDQWDIGWGCDVEDAENEIIVRAEAPGFEANEIEVQTSGNRLVLRAEHKEEADEKNGGSLRYGSFYREMTLPRGIETDSIKADYKNGVLEVHCPKGPEAQSKRIAVKAK